MQIEPHSEFAADRATRRSWAQIVTRNFSATMVSSAVDSVLRFLAYGYLARHLGPEAFGINSFMYTTTFFFGSLSDFGLRILGAREIAAHPGKVEEQVSATLSLKVVLMVTAYVLMQIFVFLTRDSAQVRLLALIYGLSLFGFNAADWILMGLEQMQYLGIAKLINGIGVFALVLALVREPEDLLIVGGIESVTFLLAGWFLLYVASRKVRIRLSFKLSVWKKLIRETFPLGISLVMIRFGSSLPVFALGLFSSDYEVGIYKAVSLLPSFVRHANLLLGDALLPTLSRIYSHSPQYFAKILALIQKYMAIGGVLFLWVGILLGEPVLPLVFGEEFRAGLDTFYILMIVAAVVCSNVSLQKLLPACYAQRQYAIVMTSWTVILTILSIILARYGSEAEAWAVLIAETLVLGLSVYYFQKLFSSIRLFRVLFKVFSSGAVAFLAILFLKETLLVAILVGLVLYVVSLMIVRIISFDDLRLIKRSVNVYQNVED